MIMLIWNRQLHCIIHTRAEKRRSIRPNVVKWSRELRQCLYAVVYTQTSEEGVVFFHHFSVNDVFMLFHQRHDQLTEIVDCDLHLIVCLTILPLFPL